MVRVYGRLDRLAPRSPAERLRDRLERDAQGCLVWLGPVGGRGYGTINIGTRQVGTHRLAWELAYGPIPAGIDVCHHCDNPPCCDPAHLFLGTRKQNMADMVAKGRQGRNGNEKKTHCVKGHPFSPENTFVNLKGSRVCITCKRAALIAHRAKRKVAA